MTFQISLKFLKGKIQKVQSFKVTTKMSKHLKKKKQREGFPDDSSSLNCVYESRKRERIATRTVLLVLVRKIVHP